MGAVEGTEAGRAAVDVPIPASELRADEARLVRVLEEFRRRQRQRPDLAVRPWWSLGREPGEGGRLGFVVEYCPAGRDSALLTVRGHRVTVEGPAGMSEVDLDLGECWELEGQDTRCPETLVNHLLRLADRVLGGER